MNHIEVIKLREFLENIQSYNVGSTSEQTIKRVLKGFEQYKQNCVSKPKDKTIRMKASSFLKKATNQKLLTDTGRVKNGSKLNMKAYINKEPKVFYQEKKVLRKLETIEFQCGVDVTASCMTTDEFVTLGTKLKSLVEGAKPRYKRVSISLQAYDYDYNYACDRSMSQLLIYKPFTMEDAYIMTFMNGCNIAELVADKRMGACKADGSGAASSIKDVVTNPNNGASCMNIKRNQVGVDIDSGNVEIITMNRKSKKIETMSMEALMTNTGIVV